MAKIGKKMLFIKKNAPGKSSLYNETLNKIKDINKETS